MPGAANTIATPADQNYVALLARAEKQPKIGLHAIRHLVFVARRIVILDTASRSKSILFMPNSRPSTLAVFNGAECVLEHIQKAPW